MNVTLFRPGQTGAPSAKSGGRRSRLVARVTTTSSTGETLTKGPRRSASSGEAGSQRGGQALARAIRDGLRAHLGNKRRLIGKKRRRIFRFDKPTGRYVLLPALLNAGTRADWPDAAPRREYLESVLRSLQIVPDDQRNGNGEVSKDLNDLIQAVQDGARFGFDEDMNAPAI